VPWTAASLAEDLRRLGLGVGDTVLVHSSLRKIGEVTGGAAGVLAAFLEVIGDEGTLVVPTFTTENSKSSRTHLQLISGLTPQQVEEFRAEMPPFDAASTPSSTGRLSEQVRLTPGALRSGHPQTSFAAIGRHARTVVADHAVDCHHGEDSPLARLRDLDAKVLLAGVDYDACTAFHLAEYSMPEQPRKIYECVVDDGTGRRWYAFESVDLDDRDFPVLGAAVDAEPELTIKGTLGSAAATVLPMAPAVKFAVRWLGTHRHTRLADHSRGSLGSSSLGPSGSRVGSEGVDGL
jgi:aminoglycoside 3-N-acetyltransferase